MEEDKRVGRANKRQQVKAVAYEFQVDHVNLGRRFNRITTSHSAADRSP